MKIEISSNATNGDVIRQCFRIIKLRIKAVAYMCIIQWAVGLCMIEIGGTHHTKPQESEKVRKNK